MLIAEDDEVLARAVAVGLRREGMAVDVALDGDDARSRLAVTDYDVVVLDRDLPGTHGDEICRALVAERSASRVLMLTAASYGQGPRRRARRWAPTITCRSRSSSPSWSPASERSLDAQPCRRPSWHTVT